MPKYNVGDILISTISNEEYYLLLTNVGTQHYRYIYLNTRRDIAEVPIKAIDRAQYIQKYL